jgi:short-subunit dehydrogenase
VDLSGNFEEMKQKLDVSEEEMGPVYMLVNNAGTSFCGKLEDLKDTDIQVLLLPIVILCDFLTDYFTVSYKRQFAWNYIANKSSHRQNEGERGG